MNEWITIGISLIASVIVAWTTSKFGFRTDIKKYVHSKREQIYFDLFEYANNLMRNKALVHDEKYRGELLSLRTKIELYASKKVIESYKELLLLMNGYKHKDEAYEQRYNPELQENAYRTEYDEASGEEYEITNFSCFEMENYVIDYQLYKNEQIPTDQEVEKITDSLSSAMRKDIGTEKVK